MASVNATFDLRRFKNLRKLFLWLAAAFIPVIFIVGLTSGSLLGSYLPAQVFALAWMLILAVLWIRLSCWSCPKCGGSVGWWPPLVAKCRRCGFTDDEHND